MTIADLIFGFISILILAAFVSGIVWLISPFWVGEWERQWVCDGCGRREEFVPGGYYEVCDRCGGDDWSYRVARYRRRWWRSWWEVREFESRRDA